MQYRILHDKKNTIIAVNTIETYCEIVSKVSNPTILVYTHVENINYKNMRIFFFLVLDEQTSRDFNNVNSDKI